MKNLKRMTSLALIMSVWAIAVPAATAAEKEFTVSKKYLVLPIKNGGNGNQLRLFVEGKELYRYGLKLAPSAKETDWYAWFPIDRYKGKKAKIEISNAPEAGFALVRQSDTIPGHEKFYKEPYRPKFHFTQKVGWNNDPNGMVYANGEWHLFYQHNPVSKKWGNMTWGHAVSKDLLHWKELPYALYPDEMGTMFSGTGAVDKKNTAGFKTGDKDVIILAYTAAGKFGYPRCPFTQGIAYSNDNGRTFTKYEGNPVVKNLHGGRERDPKILWHEPTQKWVMVLYLDRGRQLAFLTSDNLKTWEKQSEIGDFHECPELFELPVDGDKENTRWVLFGADAKYIIGAFDGKKFTPEHKGKYRVHWGKYYASQTFNNAPDGRRIQIGWFKVGSPGPYNQHFSFPHRLTLRKTKDGVRMFAEPIKEIQKLRKNTNSADAQALADDRPVTVPVSTDLLDVSLTVGIGDADKITLDMPGRGVTYDAGQQKLNGAPLKPKDGRITIRVLADRLLTEIIGNDGRVYISTGGKGEPNAKKVSITAHGGDAKLISLDVHELKSIWME